MKYILVRARHHHVAIDNLPAIFETLNSSRIFDFDYHMKIIHNTFDGKQIDELQLYVTGLTPLLISVLNYCRMFKIPVTLYHYDISLNRYVLQSVV